MDEQSRQSCFDIRKVQRNYLESILKDVPGRKVLVLDEFTQKITSNLFTMSELFNFDVFLVENILKMSEEKESSSVNTLLFVEPTIENMGNISRELGSFKYTNTFICKKFFFETPDFVNNVQDSDIEHLAIRDVESGKIRCVKEVFMEYHVINKNTFSLTSEKSR